MIKHISLSFMAVVVACALICGGCSENKAVNTAAAAPPALSIHSPKPALEVVSGDGQLGSADFGEQRQCCFTLRNNQSQAVTLRLVDKSCTCAGVQLPTEAIGPGQDAVVTLVWSPKVEVLESSSVRLWAEVSDATGNDRRRLEASGTIEPRVLVALPRGPLDFGRLSPADLEQDQNQLVVEVYSKVQSFETPTFQFNMPGIRVSHCEKLAADRLGTLQALGGYRLTLQPGKELAHGAVLAQLAIQTSVRPAPIVLEITGRLETTAVSVMPDRLSLPPRVSLLSGYRVPSVTILSRFGTCSRCEVVSVWPPIFDVKLQQVNEKTWRLEAQLSKDATQMQKRFTAAEWERLLDYGFEQGSIVLKLDHPDVRSLTIPIAGTQLSRE